MVQDVSVFENKTPRKKKSAMIVKRIVKNALAVNNDANTVMGTFLDTLTDAETIDSAKVHKKNSLHEDGVGLVDMNLTHSLSELSVDME